MNSPTLPVSKLPDVGTTIFSVMSALASHHQALNLSQGFPDFDPPEALVDLVHGYMISGNNQYPPMIGVPSLLAAIGGKVQKDYLCSVQPEEEVTITAGATEALFCAIAAVVGAGDEVIVFDPAYDSYDPVIRLQGGRAIHLELTLPNYQIDWDQVRDALSPRTRMLIINSPHNPSGAILGEEDIRALREIVASHGLYLLSDEVYEHMVFDGKAHLSLCRYEDLYARSFVISSFGKTYHATGWKVGYCLAPPGLTTEFRRIHQYLTFTVNTPVQLALADFLNEHAEHHEQLGAFYQRKRDLFCARLSASRFSVQPSPGTYFQLLDYSAISNERDTVLARRWTQEKGIATIPISVFYGRPERCTQRVLRLCFAKDDQTLEQAADILCQI